MDRYCYGPFGNNINGVDGFWTNPAIQFQIKFIKRLMNLQKEVRGENYKPWIKICNEPAHWGNQAKFCLIGDWHKRMFFEGALPFTYYWKIIIDISHCEGAYDWENELRQSDYCGDIRGYAEADRSKKTKSILAEKHGFCIPENIPEQGVLFYLDSKWCKYKWSCDGGANQNEAAAGYRIPGTTFYGPSAPQLYQAIFSCFTEAKLAGKIFYFGYFPLESFSIIENGARVWNLWFENYEKTVIDWEIAIQPSRAYEAVYN